MEWLDRLLNVLEALTPQSGYPLLFSSAFFALIFTVLYAVYLPIARWQAARVAVLLTFSIYFYAFHAGWFVLLMLASATVDYGVGRGLAKAKKPFMRSLLVATTLLVNLGLLVTFKYAEFFVFSYQDLMGLEREPLTWLDFVVPGVSISYYSFKSISYVLDVAREEIEEPETNLLHYWLYVSFFANILLGPITRATEFLPQLRQPFVLTKDMVSRGFFLFAVGLFKKLVIADFIAANYVNVIFDRPDAFTGFELLMATYGYAVQLFCDFSGYSEMAIGLALLLGLRLGPNFNEPFKARNVSEFWRRWHISLSTWFSDYVHTPLVFSWRSWGKIGLILAVLITFFLSGLWHGPRWTYVIWGVSHGVVIAYEVVSQKFRKRLAKALPGWLYNGFSLLLTFHFLCLTYIFFNAKTVDDIGLMLTRMVENFGAEVAPVVLAEYWRPFAMTAFGLLIHYAPTKWKQSPVRWFERAGWVGWAVTLFLLTVLIYQVRTSDAQTFIYAQF